MFARHTSQTLVTAAAALVALSPAARAVTGVHPAESAPSPVTPKPVSVRYGPGAFTLTPHSRIVVDRRSATRAVGATLAGELRPATGYRLPVVTGWPHRGDVVLRIGRSAALRGHTREGYVLSAGRSTVVVTAPDGHGLFDGAQTVRQLLPAAIASGHRQRARWTIPTQRIVDYPRYTYRGLMIDIARHYRTPTDVKKLIDQASTYKIDMLHLHVSDDQGFRIAIKGFPNLTKIGGRGSVGTQGRTKDPGGYWTRADYRSVVRYAARHFMTVIPEVDSPGHNNAIIMSESGDTTNPRLSGDPSDINCSTNNPPKWNYTGAVGYSAMCPESANTWAIYRAIIDQLAAMSPGPYYDVGGDEVPASVLSQERYAAFMNHEAPIVAGAHKTLMGWAELAGPGTEVPAGSVAEYWNPASGSSAGTVTGTEAVAKHMRVVMAPANHTYLDQKYAPGVPADIGLTWACPKGCDVDQFYGWDPGHYVDGVTGSDVLGVEGAIWGETTRTLAQVDYLVFPRLIALAEVGWSPYTDRGPTSPAYQDFLHRLAAQGTRLTYAGIPYYHSPEVPWQ